MTGESDGPGALSRTELDRVIRRATELQFREGGSPDDDGITEAEVLRIGGEVGLDPAHVRRALGEVRAEALIPAMPEDRGLMKRLLGAGRVRADRVVPGDPEPVEERLVRWFREAESLHPIRRRPGFSLWEPVEGIVAQIERGLRWGGRRYVLAQARQIEVTVQGLEDGFSLVTITIDVRNMRMEQGGGSVAGFSLLGGGVATVASAFLFASPIGIVAGAAAGLAVGGLGGLGIGRGAFQSKEERIRLAAEGILDRLEIGEPLKISGRKR